VDDATASTRTRNEEVAATLPLKDRQAFADAAKGFLGSIEPPIIRDNHGRVIWDLTRYNFLDSESPASVHPSLWRMAQLSQYHGLFQVTDRVYQVRGFDISNMTIIKGDSGFIVIDPLTCVETASAALQLVKAHLGDRPVRGVIYTHSHIDHFGGVKGVIDDADVRGGHVPVLAPIGFMEHAVSEYLHVGVAMGRRAEFMFGPHLRPGPCGHVTTSLGVTVPQGTSTIVEPSELINTTGTEFVLDGVLFVFQLTPGAEAPAEMNFYVPQLGALCMAETVSQQMHNLYTLRGAQVRDALAWSEYLDEAIHLFGYSADVLFISHHWPTWGRERLIEVIGMHRDLYRYIHDETLRLANHGYTPTEIAETIELPEALAGFWANQGCYGTLNHNVKAIYQRYLGWFDGDPANLHPLPPRAAGLRYVKLMGGPEPALARVREAFQNGEYRWAAELGKHLVAANPEHQASRDIQAEIFQQLGYQAESGPWRNFYLVGAEELRNGIHHTELLNTASSDMVAEMTADMLLDYLAIRLNGPKAAAFHVQAHLYVTDTGERFFLDVRNGVLHHSQSVTDETGSVTLRVDRKTLAALTYADPTGLREACEHGAAQIGGDYAKLVDLFSLFDTFSGWFDVVVPNAKSD
jgi:alkyl sulfatase BDS1-like metallo-beta-lactamase superfamily hydrolase